METQEWRSLEIIKLLRQCVVCPYCGVLVATQAGIDSHTTWHEGLNTYVDNVNRTLEEFKKYITDPVTGIQKQIQDRLDTITNYVTAPSTGLEQRITTAIVQLRNDATSAINSLISRVTALESKVGTVALKETKE